MVLTVLVLMCFALSPASSSGNCDVPTIYNSKGDLKIGFILNECAENSTSLQNTLMNSAIWATQRLNYLESTPFKLGLKIFQTCSEKDVYNSIFDLFQQDEDSYLLGLVSLEKIPNRANKLCDVLNVRCEVKTNYWNDLIRATVALLEVFNWDHNLTVVAPNGYVLEEFNTLTRIKGICVGRAIVSERNNIQLKYIYGRTVVLGNRNHIEQFLNHFYKQAKLENPEFIFVPLDGLPVKELPENSYVINPTFLEDSQKYAIGTKIVPTPLLFEIANPILNMVANISGLTSLNCNSNSTQKLECFAQIHSKLETNHKHLTPFEILAGLKIESLMNQFSYNIYRIENLTITKLGNQSGETTKSSHVQNLVPVGNFSIFDQSINFFEALPELVNQTNPGNSTNCSVPSLDCFLNCVNFEYRVFGEDGVEDLGLRLRSEAWVFAYLAISALGCIFCIAIIVFFLVRLCKKDIFEGNPTLTILLLLLVICMYSSVVPFAVTGGSNLKDVLCMTRTLSVSLTYAAAFSLLLSRCVILATISKEVGFMAHASGPTQIFLGTFMFGVQIALSLQLVDNCLEFMRLQCFVCILSYNMILLLLLICTTVFIMRSERNYKEGKYVTIAVLLITCIWSVWVPLYWIYKDYEDEILCFGLVGTASSLLGCVFIPRTYVMTISVARDKFTSALPALATATSVIDIYRASTQPIYDCINVAAINANNAVIRASVGQQPDFYSCHNLPEEFTTPKCDTPVTSDKLTRF